MFLRLMLLVVLAVITWIASADEVSDALRATPTATIAPGQIVGTTTSIAGPSSSIVVNKFLGIPYAAAPTGFARFTPPQPPAEWTSLSTQQFGDSCIQVFAPLSARPFTEAVFNNPPPRAESEDCLYINVFAPKKSWDFDNPPYPVLYWMYGGAWKFGNAGQPWYDGSHFAALEDVIVVSVNYRTNVFGLPISPTITNLTDRNLALLDQRAGLQWVQDNIHHFGGNRSRVTLFGESAGAHATDLLITSYGPGTSPPFQAGIMESGVYAYLPIPNCNNSNYNAWEALTAALDCTGDEAAKFNCIKNERTAQQIKGAQEANESITFSHACDNITFVSDPRSRLEAHNVANVPVILGSNSADGSFYTIPYGLDTEAYLDRNFPNETLQDQILAEYPLGSEGRTDEQYQLQQIQTDWFFHCPAVWYAETSATFKPTYRYIFNATFTNTRAQYDAWPTQYQGAYHSSEIPIVFTTFNGTAEPSESELSNAMRSAWANFAKNPAAAPLDTWPQVGGGSGGADVMDFGTDGKGGFGPVVDNNHCDFWRSVGLRELHL